jgi:hypothetical protein
MPYICHLLFHAGIRWYDYDPTKLLIELSYFLGLAYDLKHPPENEIQKARFQVSNANEDADWIVLRGKRAGIVLFPGPGWSACRRLTISLARVPSHRCRRVSSRR